MELKETQRLTEGGLVWEIIRLANTQEATLGELADRAALIVGDPESRVVVLDGALCVETILPVVPGA